MGVPYKLNEETQRAIIADVLSGLTLTMAAAKAGVARSSVYALIRRDPDFERALRMAEGSRQAALLRKVIEAGDGDWRAAFVLLERTAPEFRERKQVDVGVQSGVQEVFEALREHMSDSAYAELARGLAILAGVGEEPEPSDPALPA